MRHGKPTLGPVLIYGGLGGNPDQGSYRAHAYAPMLTREDILFYTQVRHNDGHVPSDDPTASPLQDRDFTGLPLTVAFSAQCGPLADDGRDYCARIIASGGSAHWHLERGLVYGYPCAGDIVPRAARRFDRAISAIRNLGATS